MSRRLILTGCTVELILGDVEGYHMERSRVKLRATTHIEDLVVQCGDRTITIKKLFLSGLTGEMLPVEVDGKVVLFTVDEVKPTAIVEGELHHGV